MPGYDQTGPMGQGVMTGRRMGRCTNFDTKAKEQSNSETVKSQEVMPKNSSDTNWGFGRGRGFGFLKGRGVGMGCRRGWGKVMQNRFRGGC